MRVFGWALFVLGALVVLMGLNMDTTVLNDSAPGLGADFVRTHNLGLLQNRELTVQIGLAILICGAIFATVPTTPRVSVDRSAHHQAAEAPDDAATQRSDDDLKPLGVTFDGSEYHFGQYNFVTARDAIAFARDNQWMRK